MIGKNVSLIAAKASLIGKNLLDRKKFIIDWMKGFIDQQRTRLSLVCQKYT